MLPNVPSDESHVDVLIIGAGPAGLMASTYLSEMGISHRIVDKLGTRALNGRADGFHVRTVEIWNSFGLGTKLLQYGHHFGEWALWTPASPAQGISRSTRAPTIGEDVTGVRTATFHQGFIEASLIGAARERGGPCVERGVTPVSMKIDQTAIESHCKDAYPIAVELQHLAKADLEHWSVNAHHLLGDGTVQAARGSIDAFGLDPQDIAEAISGKESSTETVYAKYVVGSDGGHSWVRHQLPDFQMEGASSDSVWGVIDITPITDFPDIRKNCTILSEHGTILIIPRERGLARLYIQLRDDAQRHWTMDGRFETAQAMMNIARDIFAPYKIDYRYCDWWTIYRVGQRVCNHFSYLDRIFLAGDAVHTHTPKGGQGMNVSQQDAYNLAWKLAGVIDGRLDPSALKTYEAERRPLAKALIDLDTDLAKVLDASSSASKKDVEMVYDRLRQYGSGINITYRPSRLVASLSQSNQQAAKYVKLGTRIDDAVVYNQASSTPTTVHSLLKSNGTWRVLVFGGDVGNQDQLAIVNRVGDKLQAMAALNEMQTPRSSRPFAETYLLHSSNISDTESTEFHATFFPSNAHGEHSYTMIFGDFSRGAQSAGRMTEVSKVGAHEHYGVSAKCGALVLLRPDQVVAWVGCLNEGGVDDLDAWLLSVIGRNEPVAL